jgi:GNAT superfamily N-acetyltransferase
LSPPRPDPDADLPIGRVALRPSTSEDREFLVALYGSVRAEELTLVPWTDEEKAAFVRMQFDAQDAWYREVYPGGRFSIVTLDGEPIGRLIVGRRPAEGIVIVDITLVPERRGRGIGTRLVTGVIEEADREGLPVTLRVEPWNPVRRLYLRLGFEPGPVEGVYESMTRPARRPMVS